jgi:hypothetical protein
MVVQAEYRVVCRGKAPIWKRDPPAARDMIHPELHRLLLLVCQSFVPQMVATGLPDPP